MTADQAIPTQARTTAIFRKNAADTTKSAATAEMTASLAEEDTNNQNLTLSINAKDAASIGKTTSLAFLFSVMLSASVKA